MTNTSAADAAPSITFDDLGLSAEVVSALRAVGYESPSPIQAETIPLLMNGRDVIGQAQTGTGKTAAFALPCLSQLDAKARAPQVLVLAPTRELAIQVAEAFQKYASQIKGFHVLPIYGGQDYRTQLRGLERGVHVVVGTPGRVMDHMRRGSLSLDNLRCLVLDEADEMLRMGFIDDVEWVLDQSPDGRQIALFSATMPAPIKRIAQKHLNNPAEVTIKNRTTTAETIRQRYWVVSGVHKLDALTRILEAEEFDAMIIFVRTKMATEELAGKLSARGHATAALNGDIQQKLRERTVDQLKKGQLDIIVATDVAARGLDVERISHVVNYDIPYDTESYVHRIGRTGRAGRSGDAILFVSPRENRMLRAIEKATRKPIERMQLPTTEVINEARIARFKQQITDTLAGQDLTFFADLVEQYHREHDTDPQMIAAALASLAQGSKPLLLESRPERPQRERAPREREERASGPRDDSRERRPRAPRGESEPGMQRFRVEVGHQHQVKPGNLVGAIANEAGLDAQYIGRIEIFDDYSLVDLPEGMPKPLFKHLRKVWVSGQQLQISEYDEHGAGPQPGTGQELESRDADRPPAGAGKPVKAPKRKFGGPPPGGRSKFKSGGKSAKKPNARRAPPRKPAE